MENQKTPYKIISIKRKHENGGDLSESEFPEEIKHPITGASYRMYKGLIEFMKTEHRIKEDHPGKDFIKVEILVYPQSREYADIMHRYYVEK